MAMLLCNNGQEAKGYYATFFRGRKAAFRSKPAKGIIKIKKAVPVTPQIISSQSKKQRKRDGWDSWKNEDRSSKKKKRRVCTSEGLISDYADASVEDFESLGFIKEGSYGAVYKVREKKTGEIMAMKEETEGLAPSTLAEIDILRSLEPHPNVVGFKKVAKDGSGGVYVLMELMEADLRAYIALKRKEEGVFAIGEVKKLMKQLLEGVKFLHQNSVMHRDLKPENILLSNGGGDLKICDFGLSTRFDDSGKEEVSGQYTTGVGSLWYKAPELLLGVEKYSTEVDMWAVGCIMAELVSNKVLFKGEDEEDQLEKIYCILGSPDARVCSSISSADKVLSEAGFDLLKGLLSYDQRKRTTAEAALSHAWFHED